MDDRMDDDQHPVEWLTLKAAAQRVGRSTKTVRRAVKDGKVIAQRTGDTDMSPWVVSSVSLDAHFGAPEPGPSGIEDATLSRSLVRQNDALLVALNDAEKGRREAVERAAVAETINAHLMARLQELTTKPEALEPEPTRRRRRWWQA